MKHPRGFRHTLVLTSLAALLACSPAAAQDWQVTLHVDRAHASASDDNAGSQAQPLLTLQAAVNRAVDNKRSGRSTRVVVHPGIYREFVDMRTYSNFDSADNTTPMLIEAAEPGQAVLSGSDLWTDWQPEGSVYTHEWPFDWGLGPDFTGGSRDVEDIVRRREMIFVDGAWMRQVVARTELAAGTFYVDEGEDRVYLHPPSGTDPRQATVEVAVRERVLWVEYEHNLTLRGLVFQHAAEPWTDLPGAARFTGTNHLLIEDCDFRWNNFLGLELLDLEGATVRRATLNHNGADGWGMWESKDVLVEDSETSFNNWRGDLGGFYSWSVGNKILHVHGLTIRRHTAEQNESRGLWIDEDNRDVLLEEILLRDNRSDGIWLEANPGPITVRNSTIVRNGESGLRSSYTERVTLTGNVIAGNEESQVLLVSTGSRGVSNFETGEYADLYLQHWTLEDNIVACGDALIGTLYYEYESDWPRFKNTLQARGNTWWHASDPRPFRIEDRALDFARWKSETGEGTGSRFAEPAGDVCSGEVSADIDDETPGRDDSFVLGNYPNPFQHSTTIGFELYLQEPAEVAVHLFDLLGRQIAAPPVAVLQPGYEHRLDIDAAMLPPGAFLYRVVVVSSGQTVTQTGVMTHIR